MICSVRRMICRAAVALPAAWLTGVVAAADGRPLRVAMLLSGFESSYASMSGGLLRSLQELGYVEGRNLIVERRYAHLQNPRMLPLARELVELKPDVIVTACTGSTRAAMQATREIPIVMVSVADPVGQGFVKALARPGTNVTGRSSQSRELAPKMLELLHSAAGGAKRIAVLVNTLNVAHPALWSDIQGAGGAMGLDLVRVEARGPSDLDEALRRLDGKAGDALLVLPDDPMTFNLRRQVIDAAGRLRWPALYAHREFVVEGGLMSYGESFQDSYGRVGVYVDKLVRGARAADLPIEQPTRLHLAVNMKTAGTLGVVPPRTLLLRADELVH